MTGPKSSIVRKHEKMARLEGEAYIRRRPKEEGIDVGLQGSVGVPY